MSRPKLDRDTEKGVEHLENVIQEMKNLTQDKIQAEAPKPSEIDPLTIMSKKDIEEYDAPFIKPTKSFAPIGKPNPKEEKERKAGWEYIKCICENIEIYGEQIEFWYNKFLGDPCYFWQIPVNRPVYIPRFIAEYLATRNYHRFKMRDRSGIEFMTGKSQGEEKLVIEETVRRIDCRRAGFGF